MCTKVYGVEFVTEAICRAASATSPADVSLLICYSMTCA